MWWGLHIGLTRADTLDTIYGELLDLIGIDLIQTQGWTAKEDDEEAFFDLLDTYK